VDASDQPLANQDAVLAHADLAHADLAPTDLAHADLAHTDTHEDGADNASRGNAPQHAADYDASQDNADDADTAAALRDPGADTGAHPDLHSGVPRGTVGGRLAPAGFLIRLARDLPGRTVTLLTVSYRLG
jgi:hypothetical protein